MTLYVCIHMYNIYVYDISYVQNIVVLHFTVFRVTSAINSDTPSIKTNQTVGVTRGESRGV